jgi:hypothetical protein
MESNANEDFYDPKDKELAIKFFYDICKKRNI